MLWNGKVFSQFIFVLKNNSKINQKRSSVMQCISPTNKYYLESFCLYFLLQKPRD